MDKQEHTDGARGASAPSDRVTPSASAASSAPATQPAPTASSAPATQPDPAAPSEQDLHDLRQSFNDRISHVCSAIALVVILVDLASYALGRADSFFTMIGVMVAIALLAIASLNRHSRN